ncbi:hypothetical protein HON86_02920 [Candidatus Woesearchaeota archaeon]|jgi:hypothetical protein|nr:hypothetical protein [Candidatus Woesearchaeota archaeon]MBT6734963.1 hypothetical protein [Candidatus Woesearchaeota archaeon]MBT7474812.1 hypothetical protein [Candidatus Woesearchaeota archaeon]
MLKKSIVFGLVFLIFISTVSAVGISPPRSIVYFEPNAVESVNFYVVNMGDADSRVKIFINGELSNLIIWEEQIIDLQPGEKRDFNFLVKMPPSFDEPGDHRVDLIAQEIPIEDNMEGTFIGAVTSVTSPILIRVPFDGPYLGTKINIRSSSVGQIVKLKIFLENLGNKLLNDFQGKVDIVGANGEIVKTITFSDSLGLNEFKELELLWDSTGIESGIYIGKLSVDYNGKNAQSESEFRMGDIFVKILDFQTELVTGKINNYVVNIESDWNNVIKDVYVNLMINVGEEGYNFKSTSFDLGAWEKKEIKMYVALEDGIAKLPAGEYDSTLGVFYDELSNSEDFVLIIKENTNYFVIVGVSFVIIFSILFGLYIFKNNKKGKK